MAYLHCHSCDWSQDDFYTKGYNPLTRMKDSIGWTIKPRMLNFDKWMVDEQKKYRYIPIFSKVDKKGFANVFSWNWLLIELERDITSFLHMKWWTWKKWNKVKHKAVCPKCGDRNFDID